jgi:hypothetical protein
MGKTFFQPKKASKKSRRRYYNHVTPFLKIVDKCSSRVTTKKSSKTKEGSPTPEASPERYSSSIAAPASTNPPDPYDETYGPYSQDEQYAALGPYSQASIQNPNTVLAPQHQSNTYPNVQNANYVPTPNYYAGDNCTAPNTYQQQTSQPQAYNSYPAEQPTMTDVFYTYGESYPTSFAMSEYPTEADAPEDQYQERGPQLQTWVDETSNTNLPVNESV